MERLAHRLVEVLRLLVVRYTAARPARLGHRHRVHLAGERGDVPGWVLITVMTAGLVAGLWAVAGPELEGMLRAALRSVG